MSGVGSLTKLPAMSKEQMEALEKFITASKDCSEFAKKAIIWMLRQTENLTKGVSLSFRSERHDLGEEVCSGIHNMNSAMDSTLKKMGTPMCFNAHCGYYNENGQFTLEKTTFTYWITPRLCDDSAERLTLDIEAIQAIELPARKERRI